MSILKSDSIPKVAIDPLLQDVHAMSIYTPV